MKTPGGYDWPVQLFEIIADRLLSGVEVKIVLSDFDSGDYAYGYRPRAVLSAFGQAAWTDSDLKDRILAAGWSSANEFVCESLQLASIRLNTTDAGWPSGTYTGFANHGKFFMVDEMAFYIGSQNLYISNLYEWGLLIDDVGLSDQIRTTYWEPLWEASSSAQHSGAGVTCALGGSALP